MWFGGDCKEITFFSTYRISIASWWKDCVETVVLVISGKFCCSEIKIKIIDKLFCKQLSSFKGLKVREKIISSKKIVWPIKCISNKKSATPGNKLSSIKALFLSLNKNITVTGNRSEVDKSIEKTQDLYVRDRMKPYRFAAPNPHGPRTMVKLKLLTVKVSKFFLHQLNLYQCYSLNPWKDRLWNWL